jgi:hypothetical protein
VKILALLFCVKFWSCVDSWFRHLTTGPARHIKQYTHRTDTTIHYLLRQLTQIFPAGAIHIADCIVWSNFNTCDTLVEGLLTGNLKSSRKIALFLIVCHLKNIAHFIFHGYLRHYPLSQPNGVPRGRVWGVQTTPPPPLPKF